MLDQAALTSLLQALISHAATTGLFPGGVSDHEQLSAPPGGISASVIIGPWAPARAGSGLDATSLRMEFQVRIYAARTTDPPGSADAAVAAAAIAYQAGLSAGFTLDGFDVPAGLVRSADLLGAYGTPMDATPGYVAQDGAPLRVIDVTLPLVLNDCWEQEA